MKELSEMQNEIMKKFYQKAKERVIFNKAQRNELWRLATSKSQEIDFNYIDKICPALSHQIKKSYESDRNIQSAVFSECVYAQTLANMLNLNKFLNCFENQMFLNKNVYALLSENHLIPRYAYINDEKSKILIQAGGCNGIDCALITVEDMKIYTIEFKEQGAKTSEPDLPKYDEDGKLLITEEFLKRYPQFKEMLEENRDLNFFEMMGNNIHNFSSESVNIAVTNNYLKKYADVICTEDSDGYLVMIPANQIDVWANIEGEIRPAGRNHYRVWTPNFLKRFLIDKGAVLEGEQVSIDINKLEIRRERGGNRRVSGYKINPLFFVYKENCIEKNNIVTFDINNVRQLNPTIAGKIFFINLKYENVKKYYFG